MVEVTGTGDVKREKRQSGGMEVKFRNGKKGKGGKGVLQKAIRDSIHDSASSAISLHQPGQKFLSLLLVVGVDKYK